MKTFDEWRKEQDPATLRSETAWQTVERAWKASAAEALFLLRDMIDGGEECLGRDQAISETIRELEALCA